MRIAIYILLVVVPGLSFGQKVIALESSGRYVKPGPGAERWYSPLLWAYAMPADTVILEWTDEGADSYTLERATDITFSDAVELATVGTTSYTDVAPASETKYYYRVAATKSGYQAGYGIDSTETLRNLYAWYEFSGLGYANETITPKGLRNRYGVTGVSSPFNRADTVFSITGSAPALYKNGTASMVENIAKQNPVGLLNMSTYSYIVPDSFLFIGPDQNFTLIMSLDLIDRGITFLATPVRNQTAAIVFDIRQTIALFWKEGGGNHIISYPDGQVKEGLAGEEALLNLVIQREVDTLRISFDSGNTWFTTSSATVSDAKYHIYDVGYYPMERMAYDTSILSTAQIQRVANYYNTTEKSADYNTGKDSFRGVEYIDTIPVYYSDTALAFNPTGSFTRDRIFSIGDKSVILMNERFDTIHKVQDYAIVLDHVTDSISAPIYYGVPPTGRARADVDDVHNNGTLFPYGDRLVHIEQNLHYEDKPNTIVITSTGGNYNFSGLKKIRVQKDAEQSWMHSQYHRFNLIGNTIYYSAQEWNNTGRADKYVVGQSRDNFASWEKNRLAETGSTNWFYGQDAYREDDTLSIFLELMEPDMDVAEAVFYLQSSDGYNWQSLDKAFSWDIRNYNPIPTDTLMSCCVVVQADSAKSARVNYWNYEPVENELYGVTETSGGDSLQLIYSSGGSWVKKPIGIADSTIITFTSGLSNVADNSPVMIKRSVNTYDLYCHGHNGGSGNWNVLHYRTTDKGDTWTFQGKLTTDDTRKHKRMQATKNAEYAIHILLTAAVENDANNADVWIYDITE